VRTCAAVRCRRSCRVSLSFQARRRSSHMTLMGDLFCCPELRFRSVSVRFSPVRYVRFRFLVLTASRAVEAGRSLICKRSTAGAGTNAAPAAHLPRAVTPPRNQPTKRKAELVKNPLHATRSGCVDAWLHRPLGLITMASTANCGWAQSRTIHSRWSRTFVFYY
jgi:hypothetical protein